MDKNKILECNFIEQHLSYIENIAKYRNINPSEVVQEAVRYYLFGTEDMWFLKHAATIDNSIEEYVPWEEQSKKYTIIISIEAKYYLENHLSLCKDLQAKIKKVIENHLALDPFIGRKLEPLKPDSFWSYFVESHRILYKLENDTLVIARIFDSRQKS